MTTSTFYMPYEVAFDDPLTVIRTDTLEEVQYALQGDRRTLILKNITDDIPVAIGMRYEMNYRFGEADLRKRTQDPTGTGPRVAGRLQVNRWWVYSIDSGDYELRLFVDGALASTKTIPRRVVGSSANNIPRTDEAYIAVRTRADRARVAIATDSWQPCQFVAAEWDGFLTPHA